MPGRFRHLDLPCGESGHPVYFESTDFEFLFLDRPTVGRILMEHPQSLVEATPAYHTALGAAYAGDSRELLPQLPDESLDLVVTSPPFALLRKKEYGNEDQDAYVDWLVSFAELVLPKLRETGSFVVDLGGAYKRGVPARSLYNFRVLLRLVDEVGFTLAQDFYWSNPSKLPSPIEWVNKRKLRVKDTVNTVWWFGRTEWPKADSRRVLVEYSDRMKKLLKDPESYYRAKKRPSGHDVSMGFAKDNGGAIPPNLLQIPNSESNGVYMAACKAVGAKRHPARFPARLPEFFIRFLTDPGDLVLDIFAGSNTTGSVAEAEGRRWLAFEMEESYVAGSAFRFVGSDLTDDQLQELHDAVVERAPVDLGRYQKQTALTL